MCRVFNLPLADLAICLSGKLNFGFMRYEIDFLHYQKGVTVLMESLYVLQNTTEWQEAL